VHKLTGFEQELPKASSVVYHTVSGIEKKLSALTHLLLCDRRQEIAVQAWVTARLR